MWRIQDYKVQLWAEDIDLAFRSAKSQGRIKLDSPFSGKIKDVVSRMKRDNSITKVEFLSGWSVRNLLFTQEMMEYLEHNSHITFLVVKCIEKQPKKLIKLLETLRIEELVVTFEEGKATQAIIALLSMNGYRVIIPKLSFYGVFYHIIQDEIPMNLIARHRFLTHLTITLYNSYQLEYHEKRYSVHRFAVSNSKRYEQFAARLTKLVSYTDTLQAVMILVALNAKDFINHSEQDFRKWKYLNWSDGSFHAGGFMERYETTGFCSIYNPGLLTCNPGHTKGQIHISRGKEGRTLLKYLWSLRFSRVHGSWGIRVSCLKFRDLGMESIESCYHLLKHQPLK